MSEYAEKYAANLEAGERFEDFCVDLLYEAGIPVVAHKSREKQYAGENKAGLEFKYDRLLSQTGNLFVETHEKSDPANTNFVPSGILRRDNTWLYVIGDYSVVFVFQKNVLRELFERKVSGEPKYERKTIETSRGFLLPRAVAERWAGKILRPKPDKVAF